MENLTPPANGKNAPDGAPPAQAVPRWNVASWNRCARISASASTPAPERGADPAAHDMHRDAPGAADRTASADRRPEQQRTTRRRPGLFLLRRLPACLACRISSPARAGCCRRPPRGKAGKYPGSAGRGTRILRQPPAPGRTGTASAAPMTPQPTSCTACTPCQTSQQPAAHRQHLPTPHPASPAAHLPQQITPPTAKNHPPQPAAGGVRFFT